MNYETLTELALDRIESLTDQMIYHRDRNDLVNLVLIKDEIQDLTSALDGDDASDNIFYAPRLRYDWVI